MIFTVSYTIFTNRLHYVEIEAESAVAAAAQLKRDFGDMVDIKNVLIPAYTGAPEDDFVPKDRVKHAST